MFRSIMKVLLAKKESAYGSDSSPVVGSDAIQASNIKISYKGDKLERDVQRLTLSPYPHVIGKRWVEITFTAEVKGSGTKGVVPALSDLLQACGMAEAVAVGSSVTYVPCSSTMPSMTMYVYDIPDSGNARLHKIVGCRGSFKINLTAGAFGKFEFNFSGIYAEPTDVSAPSAPTFEATLPPIVESAQFSFNSVTSLIVQALTLDIGNGLVSDDDISSANGIKDFQITSRKGVGSFSPEAVVIATQDWWTDWVSANQRALSVVIGSVSGNIVTITAPKCQVDSITEAERNGKLIDEIPFSLSGNAGNDEINIQFS